MVPDPPQAELTSLCTFSKLCAGQWRLLPWVWQGRTPSRGWRGWRLLASAAAGSPWLLDHCCHFCLHIVSPELCAGACLCKGPGIGFRAHPLLA